VGTNLRFIKIAEDLGYIHKKINI